MREQKESVIRVFDDLALRRSWERLYSGNVNRIKYNYMTRLRAVEELIGSYVTGNILDIGCGTGDLAPFIIEKEATYYGVDLSSKMIERAKSNYGVFLRNGRATFHVADCENLHFCSKKFDMVIAIALIEYLPDPIKFMIEAQRVLKDGGYFLITVPYKECINSKIRECLFPITKILFPIYVKLINQPLLRMVDVKHFSYNEVGLNKLIESKHFRRIGYRFTNFHIILYPFDHLFPKLYMRFSEHIDRKGLGEKYKKLGSNYIALFQKIRYE